MTRKAYNLKTRRALQNRVAAALALVRPAVRADGGDVELVEIDDNGVVSVRLLGGCVGCPSASITLAHGIERTLRDQVPEVSGVVCV